MIFKKLCKVSLSFSGIIKFMCIFFSIIASNAYAWDKLNPKHGLNYDFRFSSNNLSWRIKLREDGFAEFFNRRGRNGVEIVQYYINDRNQICYEGKCRSIEFDRGVDVLHWVKEDGSSVYKSYDRWPAFIEGYDGDNYIYAYNKSEVSNIIERLIAGGWTKVESNLMNNTHIWQNRYEGHTFLHAISRNNRVLSRYTYNSIFRFLSKNNQDFGYIDEKGRTFFHYMAINCNKNMVKAIKEVFKSVDMKKDNPDYLGNRSIYYAYKNGCNKVFLALLDLGAKVDQRIWNESSNYERSRKYLLSLNPVFFDKEARSMRDDYIENKEYERNRVREEKRIARRQLIEEERRIAEQKRVDERRRIAEQRQAAKERRAVEQRQANEEKRIAEQKRIDERNSILAVKRDARIKKINDLSRKFGGNCSRKELNNEIASCMYLSFGPKLCSQAVNEATVPGDDTIIDRMIIGGTCATAISSTYAKHFVPPDINRVIFDEIVETACENDLNKTGFLLGGALKIYGCAINMGIWAERLGVARECKRDVLEACGAVQ